MKIFSKEFATNGLLFLLTLLVFFHLLILVQVIPYDIVWGSRLKSTSEMMQFEIPSILTNLLLLMVVAIKGNKIKLKVNSTILRVFLFAMFALFVLNTLGNLVSQNEFEKMVFPPITILMAILSLRLALVSDKK